MKEFFRLLDLLTPLDSYFSWDKTGTKKVCKSRLVLCKYGKKSLKRKW